MIDTPRVAWTAKASKALDKADARLRRRIGERLDKLASALQAQASRGETPRPPAGLGSKPLTGDRRGLHRLRVAEWRVIYRIDRDGRIVVVTVVALGPRGQVYDS